MDDKALVRVTDADENENGGEGAAGPGVPAVFVKYADGEIDEVEREVRLRGIATSAATRTRPGHVSPCRGATHHQRTGGAALPVHARAGAAGRRRQHARRSAAAAKAGQFCATAPCRLLRFPEAARPLQVSPEVLNLIMDYCRFHRAAGRSDKARKRASCDTACQLLGVLMLRRTARDRSGSCLTNALFDWTHAVCAS
jgi:hypothetical protein